MVPFSARVELKGEPAAWIIGFGLFILFFVGMFAVMVWYGQMPAWIGWLMITFFGAASVGLFVSAAHCMVRRIYWVFEADKEKLVWFRSDRSGAILERKEVRFSDIVKISRSRGGDSPGGLYLVRPSGECISIGGVAEPEGEFLDWIPANHPNIVVEIE